MSNNNNNNFFSFILERWEVKENLEFLKEYDIKGLYNTGRHEYYLPILIPF